MVGMWWIIALAVGAGVLAGIGIALAWRPGRSALRESEFATARREFHRHREHLEVQFLKLAAASGKPRGLVWVDCDFDDDVTYARDRRTGQLSAFVAVTISFEAVEGGGMEHVEAVSNLRAATAVFHYERGHWQTGGRVVFNLNPAEAVNHFRNQLEMIEQETRAGQLGSDSL